MKKLIVSLLMVIVTSIPLSALSYRGFAEVGLGSFFHKSGRLENLAEYYDEANFNFSINTTHGIQLNRQLFIGVGVDFNTKSYDEFFRKRNICVSTYGDIRYDMSITKKWSPYINLKVGYRMLPSKEFVTLERKYNDNEYEWRYGVADISSLLINPSVGARLKLSSKCGLNFGLGYIPFILKNPKFFYYTDSVDGYKMDFRSRFVITFNIGVDF